MKKNVPFLNLQSINTRYAPQFESILNTILEKGWFLQGDFTKSFEESFARYCGVSYCVGVANGLDALTLILMAKKILAQWEDGDEVIVPAHTFIATAQAIIRAGLTPIFVDIRSTDYLLDNNKVESRITPKTRALLPVHLYGKVAPMQALLEIARRYNLFVVEDAAQAHGAFGHIDTSLKKAGALGNAAAFSFYPGKNLGALGDGGCITTNEEDLAEMVRILGNYGAVEKYHHEYLGMNSRLDELQAAFLNLKLQDLEKDNAARRQVAKQYFDGIKTDAISLPYNSNWEEGSSSVFHIFPVFSPQRESIQRQLREQEIQTLIHYPIPLHQQKCLQAFNRQNRAFPCAEKIASTVFSLPISPIMKQDEVDYIIQCLNQLSI